MKKHSPNKVPATPTEVAEAVGCDACSQTGYLGRTVIAEIVTIDDEMKELTLQKSSVSKILETARKKGMLLMKEDGLIKVAKGHTTMQEIQRVINVSTD